MPSCCSARTTSARRRWTARGTSSIWAISLGAEGEVVLSRSGDLSLRTTSWLLTAKSLRPLPDKHRGISDPETRVRQRYLDLVVNPAARRRLIARSAVIRAVRNTLDDSVSSRWRRRSCRPIHGGANARPFVTHINAYDLELYLRIAPELYLKRLMVGGVDQVFEIGRNFRNEGADATHNPEFTMLEAYQAYGDYTTMRDGGPRADHAGGHGGDGGTIVAARATATGRGRPRRATGRWSRCYDAISAAAGVEVDRRHHRRASWRRWPTAGDRRDPTVDPRRGGAGAVRAAGRGHHRRAHVLHRLPGGGLAADPGPPRRSAAGRALGPGRLRRRDRHRVLRAGRPGRAARPATAQSLQAAGGRPGGDGARRGLPRRARARDAAHRRARHGRRPAGDDADRARRIRETIAFPLVRPRK